MCFYAIPKRPHIERDDKKKGKQSCPLPHICAFEKSGAGPQRLLRFQLRQSVKKENDDTIILNGFNSVQNVSNNILLFLIHSVALKPLKYVTSITAGLTQFKQKIKSPA